jgi:hypothetical protein
LQLCALSVGGLRRLSALIAATVGMKVFRICAGCFFTASPHIQIVAKTGAGEALFHPDANFSPFDRPVVRGASNRLTKDCGRGSLSVVLFIILSKHLVSRPFSKARTRGESRL